MNGSKLVHWHGRDGDAMVSLVARTVAVLALLFSVMGCAAGRDTGPAGTPFSGAYGGMTGGAAP